MITIEESIFKGLLFDEVYCRTVYPFLDEAYFEGTYKTLFRLYKELFDKYNTIPTLEALAISMQKAEIGESEFDEIVKIIESVSKNADERPDTSWLIDETEEYCRDKAIYNAICASFEILNGSDSKMDKHAIPDLLDEALAVSFDTTIGMEFGDDAERRYDIYSNEDARLEIPLDALMTLTNGGFKKKSLIAALAWTNVGKSSLMCFLAGEYLKMGKNVLYITLEMGEEVVYERIDANLLDTPTSELSKLPKEEFLRKVNKIKDKSNGKLYVKEYPTSAAHAGHFRHLLKELKQKKKFVPDIVFVDYINICASSRYRSLSGVNSYTYVKAIAEELRGLAVEFDVPVFSATQVNRDGANSSSPDMTATSESAGLPMTLDFMFAITTDEVLQDNGQQMFHLLKTRWGNKANVKPQLVGVNFEKMRYYSVNTSGNRMSTEEVKNKVGQNRPTFDRKKDGSNAEQIDWEAD